MPKDTKKQKRRLLEVRKTVKFYLVPLVAGLIFLLVLSGLIIPRVEQIFASLETISKSDSEIADYDEKLSSLSALTQKDDQIKGQLAVINSTAPSGTTEVVKFRDTITEMIRSYNLEIKIQQLSETNLEPTTVEDSKLAGGSITLQELPFNFEVSGVYSNILGFINSLSSIDEFVVVREMELSSAQSGDDESLRIWNLKLKIDKYQFKTEDQTKLDEVYRNIPPTAKISERILKYIESKQDAE
jgi:Tfp pilus assembly protein PilO